MGIYLSSDQHLEHANILKYCPNRNCSSLEEHNETLIQNHNSMVSNTDIIIYLGDLILGNHRKNIPKYVPQLNGIKILIRGNHDYGFKSQDKNYPEESKKIYLDNGIDAVFDGIISLQTILDYYKVVAYFPDTILCHFPYKNTPLIKKSTIDRYANKMPEYTSDMLLLCGHTHTTSKQDIINMINVGVDAWNMFPVSLSSVLELYSNNQEIYTHTNYAE